MHKWRAVLLFFGCTLLGMSIGSALASLIVYLAGNIREISSLPKFIQQVAQLPNGWYVFISVQAISHLFSYLIPALVFWYLFEYGRWTDFQTKPLRSVSCLWIGLLSVIAILPFNELVIKWNQRLELPSLLSNIEQWMRRKEQEGELLTNQLIAFNSLGQLYIAILVIGFIASVGEEIFFRGVVQRKLIEWTANTHISIWLAAILFSAAHFQFYGFFPRLLLGVLFGYLYFWSGNIWVAILAHFINNSLIVITIYIEQQPFYSSCELKLDTTTWVWVLFSAIGATVILFYFYQTNHKRLANLC